MSFYRRQPTTADLAANAARVAAKFPNMVVRSNGYGVHIHCPECHASHSGPNAEVNALAHQHSATFSDVEDCHNC